MNIAGVMSGTSADGLDVAIVSITSAWHWRLLAHRHVAFSARDRNALLQLATGKGNAADIAGRHVWLGRRIGRAVLATTGNTRLDAVASHGQTIFHSGRHATLQIGDPASIAAIAGVPVISDFRSADIAQGGEGAPLVPWADWRIFTHPRRFRVALNLGGIANITLLPPAASADQVIGFDTGPGNMAMDAFAPPYDRGGRLAAQGSAHAGLLQEMLRHPFFRRRPPKSCGREQFGAQFVAAARRRYPRVSRADFMATLVALTAQTVAAHLPAHAEVIAAGGGTRNPTFMRALAQAAPTCRFLRSDELGVPAQAREAMAFALLGAAHLSGLPANLPRVTGARRPVVLGSLTPAPKIAPSPKKARPAAAAARG